MDLVTEGIITLGKVLDYVKACAGGADVAAVLAGRTDGASQITRLLLEEATEVCFFVGGASNPAYRQLGTPIESILKTTLIEELKLLLQQQGKQVSVQYF